MSYSEDWQRWADEREAKAKAAPKPKNDVQSYVRLIRRAIRDAEADGYVVDFEWNNHYGSTVDLKLRIVHESQPWAKAITIYPEEK